MSFRFDPNSSSPATPERKRTGGSTFSFPADHPSTTPAGPAPSSVGSFTPAGDPSPSYLQSSIGGALGGKIKTPNFGRPSLSSSKSRSTRSNVPLGSSIRGTTEPRQSSGLSKHSYSVLDDLSDDEDDDDLPPPSNRPGTYAIPDDISDDSEEGGSQEEDAEGEVDEENEEQEDDEQEDEDVMGDGEDDEYDVEEDLLREIVQSGENFAEDEMDVMMAAPDATERMQREADDIFRASSMRSAFGRRREFKFPDIAKDLYVQLGYAEISESHNLIMNTEEIIHRLYDEGVGAEDDKARLDNTLSAAADHLISVWEPYSDSLPKSDIEHEATVGPGPNAPAFEKASWISALAFKIHHPGPLKESFFGGSRVPLPYSMFKWQEEYHDPSTSQIDNIRRHHICPAAHALFWQGVYTSLIRGNISTTVSLLRKAGWERVKKGPRADAAFTSHALANIIRAVEDVCQIMEACPGVNEELWDIRSSDWTLFRLKAKAAKEALISFAEGKDRPHRSASRFSGPDLDDQHSLSGLARKAESRLPWDVYESLQSLYSILIGEVDAITAAAQDWCEATIGLFGWWDDGHNSRKLGMSRSQSIIGQTAGDEVWLDRLAMSFHAAIDSDFHFNTMDPVEVCIACVFEGNVEGVIGFLRAWSLPVASTVAEIASLGGWLPPPEPQNLISMDSLDMEDLEVLGMNQSKETEDKDGIKDTTLIQYARALNDIGQLTAVVPKKNASSTKITRAGWEIAVEVVGRTDSRERSEEMVSELLHGILDRIGPKSNATVDKIWSLLNHLGMITFAEDTAEKFGDILKENTFRFGDMLWYYALAHRPGKVRDVLNGLISCSLAESFAYPLESEMDDVLRKLLTERTATLERFVKQDYEAAELLGKMLSGYFTLRKFYELRDGGGKTSTRSHKRRQLAATALTFVIASADENIRGGLYDDTCDAVVNEDFLLALLGEASVFVNQSPSVISLEQIDILLKAVEDIQTVGSRVYEAADQFFQVVLSSGAAKGSTPADLMKKSTSSLGGSLMMAESSMAASQLHKTIRQSGSLKGPIKRTWDWRTNVLATSSSEDVLKKIRLGLTRDLANLWLEQADSVIL